MTRIIVRQHSFERQANKEVTTVKTVVILYTDGIFGTDHEIISYGSRTKTYFLDHLEFNKKILATPLYDTFLGEVKFNDEFFEKIYGMVNEHLDCDCYMVFAPKFDVGAPHR
ncbi:MAG: hypothetical protein ACOYXT_29905 [Bacteroidota bacterium]